MRWTEEQDLAIHSRQNQILVAAAAGSGKTAVLSERILRILREGGELSQMLVVTFTNAAAEEMKGRIRKKIREEQGKSPKNGFWQKQIDQLEWASIQTFHSFCKKVIDQNLYLLPFDKGYSLIQQQERDRIRMDEIRAMLERHYDSEREEVQAIFSQYRTPKSDRRLLELIDRLQNFLQRNPDRKVAMTSQAGWEDLLREEAFLLLDSLEKTQLLQLELCEKPGGPKKYLAAIESDIALTKGIMKILHSKDYGQLKDLLPLQFKRFSSIRKAEKAELDERLIQAVKRQRDATKKNLKNWTENLILPIVQWQTSGMMTEQANALLYLAKEFDESLRQRKVRDGVMDFDDLETYAYQLLKIPAVARRIQKRYRTIFVDEYQDTSEMQEAVLNCMNQESQVFYVGDGKQSIYQFRGATPRLFLDKMDGKNEGVTGIRLNHNFRSSESVIDGINAFFNQRMTKEFGGVAYRETDQLKAGLTSIGNEKPQFVVLKGEAGQEAEVLWVTDQIQRLLDQGHQPASIAVLARSLQPIQEAYRNAFQKKGIPFQTSQPYNSKDLIVIEMFQALLFYLNGGISDEAFLAVMRYPLWKFEPAEMAKIRIEYPGIRFEAAARKYSKEKKDTLSKKLTDLFQEMDALREQSCQLPLGDLLDDILDRNRLADTILAMPDGQQKHFGLRAYVDSLKDRVERKSLSLHHLCMLIEEERREGITYPIPSVQGDQGVRLMTIHGSKGLEFDTVFLVHAGQPANLFDLKQSVLIHEDFGLAMTTFDKAQEAIRIPLERNIAQQVVKRQQISEELRIFYVAMTRAVERLFVVAHDRQPERTRDNRAYLSTVAGGMDYPSLYHWMLGAGMDQNPNWEYVEDEWTVNEAVEISTIASFSLSPDQGMKVAEDTEVYGADRLKKRKVNLTEWIQGQEKRQILFQKNSEAIERGNAFHEVLEKIPLSDYSRLEDAMIAIDRLSLSRQITRQTADLVSGEDLFRWNRSELGQRILAADQVLREKAFVGRLPDDADALYAQGKIDCLFLEKDQWVIVDYKHHFSRDLSGAASQVKAYAQLLRDCFGLVIKEAYLYEWDSGMVLQVDLN